MSELVETGEAFVRHLDKLEGESPGHFYPVGTLVEAMLNENIELPSDVSIGQFLEKLQGWDWIESNGDGFETEIQSFRVTAKGQYRAAASVDYAAQYKQAVDALPEAPVEYQTEAGHFGDGDYGSGAYGGNDSANRNSLTFNSGTWTGLPSNFQFTQEIQAKLVGDLGRAEVALSSLGISQHESSQARAYIIAMRMLAEAPEPPTDIIWELLNRASQISGIAALFVSIMALFASVAH